MAREWQYLDGDKLIGPFTKGELKKHAKSGKVESDTLITNSKTGVSQFACEIPGIIKGIKKTREPVFSPKEREKTTAIGQRSPESPKADSSLTTSEETNNDCEHSLERSVLLPKRQFIAPEWRIFTAVATIAFMAPFLTIYLIAKSSPPSSHLIQEFEEGAAMVKAPAVAQDAARPPSFTPPVKRAEENVVNFEVESEVQKTMRILRSDPATSRKMDQIERREQSLDAFQRQHRLSDSEVERAIKKVVTSNGGNFDYNLEDVKRELRRGR